jgi:hypothetical protein
MTSKEIREEIDEIIEKEEDKIYKKKEKIKVDIKVYESSTETDDYRLQYYYFYIMRSKDEFKIEIIPEVIITVNYLFYENNYYFVFWSKKELSGLDIKYNDDLYITYFLVKTEDSYILDVSNKKSKPFTKIEEIMENQFLDLRRFMNYKLPVILSSVWLNILTSNKLLYYRYFIENNIILNTTIENLSLNEINYKSKKK